MDSILWVIIAASVAIALAGIVMFIAIGSDSGLPSMFEETRETQTDRTCIFMEEEVEEGRIDCDDPQVSECDNISC